MKLQTKKYELQNNKGFTLVEMIVAVALFSVVMVVGMGALLNVLNANRQAQAIQTAVNNLNLAMEMISREIRTGHNYHCGDSGSYDKPKDCLFGDDFLAFEPYDGDINDPNDQTVFKLEDGRIKKSEYSGSGFSSLTSEELVLQFLNFIVVGSSKVDNIQPKVLVVAKGYVGVKESNRTFFNLQTTVSQRIIDF